MSSNSSDLRPIGAGEYPVAALAPFLESLAGSADYCPAYTGQFTEDHRRLYDSLQASSAEGFAAFLATMPEDSIQRLADDLMREGSTIHNVLLGEIAVIILRVLAGKNPQAAMDLYHRKQDWLLTLHSQDDTLEAVLVPTARQSPEQALDFYSQKVGNIRIGWKGDGAFLAMARACVPHGAARMLPLLARLRIDPDLLETAEEMFAEEEPGDKA